MANWIDGGFLIHGNVRLASRGVLDRESPAVPFRGFRLVSHGTFGMDGVAVFVFNNAVVLIMYRGIFVLLRAGKVDGV